MGSSGKNSIRGDAASFARIRRPPPPINRGDTVCRNIKTLFNFEPPVSDEEIRAASLQFVRKLSGFNKPSKANEAAFLAAIDQVAAVSRNLLGALETNAPPRSQEDEAAKARVLAAQRFSRLLVPTDQ